MAKQTFLLTEKCNSVDFFLFLNRFGVKFEEGFTVGFFFQLKGQPTMKSLDNERIRLN